MFNNRCKELDLEYLKHPTTSFNDVRFRVYFDENNFFEGKIPVFNSQISTDLLKIKIHKFVKFDARIENISIFINPNTELMLGESNDILNTKRKTKSLLE